MKTFTFATMTAAIALSTAISPAPTQAQDSGSQFIGQLIPVGYNFCQRGTADANGQLLSISQNTALFSLYGTTFGGDGRTTFGLPDLQGRAPMHTGTGPGLTPRPLGQKSGVENVALTAAETPVHTHTPTLNVSRSDATTRSPVNAYFARAAGLVYEDATAPTGDKMKAGTAVLADAGGGAAHNNMQPYLVMRWCVATTGIYPSRS